MKRRHWHHPRRTRSWVRFGLWFLAASAALVGPWALLAPRSFYDSFPGAGFAWVSLLPPYNEHLVRDVGGLYTGFVILFIWCAVTLDHRLMQAALVGWSFSAIPHLLFHLFNGENFDATDKFFQNGSLIALAVVPILILVSISRQGSRL